MNSQEICSVPCLISVLILSWVNVCSLEACDIIFEMFPGINDTMDANEFTTVNITFKLKGDTCHSKDSFLITVGFKTDIECNIRHANEKCSVSSGITTCTCTEHDGYMFSKSVSRSDQGVWRWILYKGTSKWRTKNITFNILYPTHVTSLTVNGSAGSNPIVVSGNQTVEVFCSWEPGIPTSSVRLIDSSGNTLTNKLTNDSNNITYNYVYGCHDSGEMRCEAGGSEVKRSATVNVRCPPVFHHSLLDSVEAIYGKNINFSFPINVSYIDDCHLIRRNTTGVSDTDDLPNLSYHCGVFQDHRYARFVTSVSGLDENKCRCRMQGKMEKTMSVHIYDITTTDIGLWQVNVSNEFGSAVTGILIRSSHKNVVENDDAYKREHDTIVVVAIVAGVSIFAVTLLITIIISFKRAAICFALCTSKTYDRPKRKRCQDDVFYRNIEISAVQSEMPNIYEEIQERTDIIMKDDYLQPIPAIFQGPSLKPAGMRATHFHCSATDTELEKSERAGYLHPLPIQEIASKTVKIRSKIRK